MHRIYSSNKLEFLCQKLADKINEPVSGIFSKEMIITQSAGMKAWLKTELTRHNGVLANFEFINQDSFFAAVYQLITGKKLQNNLDNIRYGIYNLLGSQDFREEFPEVSGYYDVNFQRRIQLSAKIADLFDQYQLYRPEMVEGWGNDNLTTENPEEVWQLWLWKRLKIEPRFKIRDSLMGKLEEFKDKISKTYPRISLFGITIFTDFHLGFFRELGKYTNVDFYLSLPTDNKEQGNELLASFGSKFRELTKLVEEKLGDYEYERLENPGDTLLSGLQNEILNNTSDLVLREDDSIQINSCYTPVREAECLYNYLLDLFEKDRQKYKDDEKKQLKPGDILVMVSDISKYAPFVKAVFKNAPVTIPVQVSGEANNSEDTITAALEQILNFAEDDLSSEKVISLLEHNRIKKRFGIKDCNYVRSVVRKANIRFGRVNSDENESCFVSWKYGLDKILLGYAMLDEREFDGKYPFIDTEATESHDLFRLKVFVERLCSVIDAHAHDRTLKEWKNFLFVEVIQEMIFHDDFEKEDRMELSSISRALSFTDNLDFAGEVPFVVFLEELKRKLFTESGESKLNTGRVTISPAIPARGLPYRIICFIGLNNDIFPGKNRFLGFDLMREKYLQGDRDKKETDKYLFLDTVLSAGEKLYLSYIGQNIKDNTELPPSIVLDILDDYLCPVKTIIVRQPLHGFSSAYHPGAKRQLFTYLYGGGSTDFEPGEAEEKQFDELPVNSFVRFFENPIDWYFDNILGIKYESDDDTLPETELFGLDSLQEWFVKQELIKMHDDDPDSFIGKGKKEGLLPLKNLGTVTVEELTEEIAELKAKYDELTAGNAEQDSVIDLVTGETRITGTIGSIYGREYISYAFSDRSKYRVRAYLNALLLYSQNRIVSAHFIYLKKNNDSSKPPTLYHEPITVIESEVALNRISELMEYFRKGLLEPLRFTPDAAKKVIKAAKVENIFREEAEGDENASLPPNYCVGNLYDKGDLKKFDIENFNKRTFKPEVYNEERFDEIKSIAAIVNLNIA